MNEKNLEKHWSRWPHHQGSLSENLRVTGSHQADAGDPELEERRGKLRSQISTHVGFRNNDINCRKRNSLFCAKVLRYVRNTYH